MNAERFNSFVRIIPGGCWEWIGPRTPRGRLMYRTEFGRRVEPNRYAAELEIGALPDGHLYRRCGNPLCVRFAPGHWETAKAVQKSPVLPLKTELSESERQRFHALYRQGARAEYLMSKFRLTGAATQRELARVMSPPSWRAL